MYFNLKSIKFEAEFTSDPTVFRIDATIFTICYKNHFQPVAYYFFNSFVHTLVYIARTVGHNHNSFKASIGVAIQTINRRTRAC